LLSFLVKTYFENVKAPNIIDFIKETHFISNFNVFILMFVIYFLFQLNSLDLTFIGFTFLLH